MSENLIKVSVLLSVYNGQNHLKQCIESVLNQSYQEFEFIIIDDNSNDNSAQIIKSYQDDRIFFVQNDENIGLTKSLNKALSLAKGKYIARIDHDDIYLKNKLQKQIDFVTKNPQCKILFTDVIKIDEFGNELPCYSRIKTPEDIYYHMHFINPVIHPTVMIEKSVIISVGGYDEDFKFAQDYELWSRLLYQYKFFKLNEPLLKYRVNSKQISKNYLEKQKYYAEKVFIKMMNSIGIEEINEKVLYFHKFAYEFNNKINFDHIQCYRSISKAVFKNIPLFLDKQRLKKIYYKNLVYYIIVFLSKIEFLKSFFKYVIKFFK